MARRRSQSTRRGVAVCIAVAVALVGGLLLVSVLAHRGTLHTQLGDAEFRAGRTDILADQIRAHGPALFSGLGAGVGRDVYVLHAGSLDGEGWLAVAARAPGQPDRNCSLQWTGKSDLFVDPCTKVERTPDGLITYPTHLGGKESRFLYVDLRGGAATTTP